MTKRLRKAIMLKSKPKRKFNNNKFEENSKKYKQQRNYCVKHLRKWKMEYFQNMDLIRSMIAKCYGKPWSQDFQTNGRLQTIILTEEDIIMKNEKLIADTFNRYFAGIAKALKLKISLYLDLQILMISFFLVLLITSKTMKV